MNQTSLAPASKYSRSLRAISRRGVAWTETSRSPNLERWRHWLGRKTISGKSVPGNERDIRNSDQRREQLHHAPFARNEPEFRGQTKFPRRTMIWMPGSIPVSPPLSPQARRRSARRGRFPGPQSRPRHRLSQCRERDGTGPGPAARHRGDRASPRSSRSCGCGRAVKPSPWRHVRLDGIVPAGRAAARETTL